MKQEKLVKKAIKGNEAAFEALVTAESEQLYKTAFLYVRNKEDALDVLQETVYKAFISIEQLKNPEYFSTWLTKILIRNAYQLLNSKKKTILTGDDFIQQLAEKESNSLDQPYDLPDALSKLSPHYRTVIILFYFHDLSIQTIADTMKKPEGTIKTYLRRAKIELKKILEGGDQFGQGIV